MTFANRKPPDISRPSHARSVEFVVSSSECSICKRRPDDDDFPSVRERLREAHQLLLEAGLLLREAEARVAAAEQRAARAEAKLAAMGVRSA